MTFSEFIFVKENSVSSLDCDRLINYFDKNTHKHRVGGLSNSINSEVKASTDIIFDEPDSTDLEIIEVLNPFLVSLDDLVFGEYFPKFNIGLSNLGNNWSLHPSFNLQKYLPGQGFYAWHSESSTKQSSYRKLVWMFYLNDVENGGTQFEFQNITTEAKKGSLVVWPADWTHTHRGQISNVHTKYILTGWYSFS